MEQVEHAGLDAVLKVDSRVLFFFWHSFHSIFGSQKILTNSPHLCPLPSSSAAPQSTASSCLCFLSSSSLRLSRRVPQFAAAVLLTDTSLPDRNSWLLAALFVVAASRSATPSRAPLVKEAQHLGESHRIQVSGQIPVLPVTQNTEGCSRGQFHVWGDGQKCRARASSSATLSVNRTVNYFVIFSWWQLNTGTSQAASLWVHLSRTSVTPRHAGSASSNGHVRAALAYEPAGFVSLGDF